MDVRIKKHQARYVKRYNKRHKVAENKFGISENDRVQYVNGHKNSVKGAKLEPTYLPLNGYVLVATVNLKTNTCHLKDPKTGKLLLQYFGKKIKSFPLDQIVPFYGALEIKPVDVKQVKILRPRKKRKIKEKRSKKRPSSEALCSDIESFDPSWW